MSDLNPYEEGLAVDLSKANDRIRQLQQALKDHSSVSDRLAEQLEALERENRLYRIMVEDCDRQRKTQYARAEAAEAVLAAMTAERDEWRRLMQLERQIADKNADKADAAEARLAKAVEALRKASRQLDWCTAAMEISSEIDATLAEMEKS